MKKREHLQKPSNNVFSVVPTPPVTTISEAFILKNISFEAATPKLELHHAAIPKWYSNRLRKEFDKEGEKQQTLLKFKSKQPVVSTREGRLNVIAEFIVIKNQVC